MPRLRLFALLALFTLLLPAAAVYADGIIIEPPPPCELVDPCPPGPHRLFPLTVQNHHVTVTIENQVATTRVEELFRNDNDYTVEGTYIFPIPVEATVNDFAMWIDGERVAGKVLSADEARQVYDDIVRRMVDPALLEYAGRGAVQASIFPIPAGETRQVALEYTQVLRADNGLIHYRYPLNTEKFSAQPLEQVSISVKVVSKQAVRAIYSPSHEIAVARDGEFRFSAGYEASYVLPNTDFDLYYSVAAGDIGLNLITYRDPASGDGYFLLLAAPSVTVDPAQVLAKDVVIVLDQSGSMEGEKFAQAQGALDFVLGHLNPEDRFNIIAFSTGTRPYARGLQPASEAGAAGRWVHTLRAEGGTDINLALLEALAGIERDSSRPAILIFLTDGLATEGVTDTDQILNAVQQSAPKNVRLFAFGVGDDVDTLLLDTLVEQQHGASSYVRPGERIDEAVSGFYGRVSAPVLSNLALDFGGVTVEDIYPAQLPDLFAGTQLVVAGRFRDGGSATVTLTGFVNGKSRTFTYPEQNFQGDSAANDFVPRLWATRRIGHLLTEIRLHGENQELIDSLVKLSVRFGIVTPYTSYLVTETDADILTDAGRDALAASEYAAAVNTQAPSYGADAVDKAQAESALSAAGAPAPVGGAAADVVRIAGSRTFLLRDGVWIDTGFDATSMQALPVSFASDAYFDLLSARPELAGPFALGAQVIALASDGTAYQVTTTPGQQPNAPATYTPVPEAATAEPTTVSGGPVVPSIPHKPVAPASGGLCAAALLAPAALLGMVVLGRKKRV